MNAISQTTQYDQMFQIEGFVREDFLGVWMKHANGRMATISDGQSINGNAYEVQVTTDDGRAVDAHSPDGDNTPEAALAYAAFALYAPDGDNPND